MDAGSRKVRSVLVFRHSLGCSATLKCYRKCYNSMLERYLTKRKRSKFWQLRVPVPKDLQASFGRKEFTRSLQAIDDVEAATNALKMLQDLHAEWKRLRESGQVVEGGHRVEVLEPTEGQMLSMAAEIYEKSLAIAQQTRSRMHIKMGTEYVSYLEMQEKLQTLYIREMESGNFTRWTKTSEEFLFKKGLSVSPETRWIDQFNYMFAEVTIAAVDLANRRDRGELAAKPSSDVLSRARMLSVPQSVTSTDLAFSLLVETFMRQWKADIGKKLTNTEQQKLATFKLFRGFWGDKPIHGVRAEDAAQFRDKLKLLDPHWARSPAARKLEWGELLDAFGNRTIGLADGTMNRHMDALKDLWNWAKKRGHCAGENPFDGFFKRLKPGVNVRPYIAWETSELTTLLYPGPRRSDVLEVIIVAMFTGMRLDEIASMTWSRIRTEGLGENAVSYFQIDDAKTPAGIRQVPIHPALAWLTERKSGASEARVWPKFNEEGVGKKAGADAGREFSSYKASLGFGRREKAFHSFRKNVTRIMERAGVPENDWAQVFGHERGFTYSVYNPDGITLERKAQIIRLIDYPGVSVPHPTLGAL